MNGFAENGNNAWGDQFTPLVRDGVRLVETNVPDGKTLLYVDFTHVFNFAAEALSPRGTMLWYDEYGTFARSKLGHSAPEAFFADVDYVMLPKKPYAPDGIGIWLELYQDYLDANYAVVEETANFWMFAKKVI